MRVYGWSKGGVEGEGGSCDSSGGCHSTDKTSPSHVIAVMQVRDIGRMVGPRAVSVAIFSGSVFFAESIP